MIDKKCQCDKEELDQIVVWSNSFFCPICGLETGAEEG